jgi:8-oxo-dGTP pyrophosphatase MutT (NUDIX family)
MVTIAQIRDRLATLAIQEQVVDHRAPTAVALILRMEPAGPAVFFIERAIDDRDPWSGNIGFPGGRVGPGDRDLSHTAERETMEEVGIALAGAERLGRLPDIVGAHLPVRVACFVYLLDSVGPVTLNAEVNDAFWVPLAVLADPARQLTAQVDFAGDVIAAPAIRLPLADKAVLWGITYRLVKQFLDIVLADQVREEQ